MEKQFQTFEEWRLDPEKESGVNERATAEMDYFEHQLRQLIANYCKMNSSRDEDKKLAVGVVCSVLGSTFAHFCGLFLEEKPREYAILGCLSVANEFAKMRAEERCSTSAKS